MKHFKAYMEIKAKEIQMVDLDLLVENPKNNNTHPKEQIERLAKLIKHTGFRNPLVVSNRSGYVLCGHGRIAAAKQAGLNELPVIYQDFKDEAEEYAYMTADNAIHNWSSLDLAKVNAEMLDLGPDFDIDMLGIKDFVIEPIEKFEAQSDEDEVPEVVHPITRRGDIWLLGNHRLMCGDSTMIDDVEKLMSGEKADMVFTDPPYRMQVEGGYGQVVGQAARKLEDAIKHLCEFDPDAFLGLLPVVFNKGIMNSYVFCNKDLVPDYLKWAVESGYSFNILFWKKPNAIPLGGSHRPDVEYLLLFRKAAIWNNGLKDVNYSKCLEYGRVSNKQETGGHPTPKPIELIDNEIKISSNSNSVVVDFFNGSGSTLISCEKNNRKCRSMELDERFCDVTIKRWEQYTGKKAILESTNQTYEELKLDRV
jgi:DNA modification methylase